MPDCPERSGYLPYSLLIPWIGSSFSRHRSVNFHPSVQNRSTLQLIYQQSMPVAVSRKIEYFVRTLGLDLDVRLFPVVLTLDQVQYYELPRTPIKETERRRGGLEDRYGQAAVEVDALEALHPRLLHAAAGG